MRANPLLGQVGGCWALEILTFLGPKWHSPNGLMSFHRAQKSLDFQGPTPCHLPSYFICPYQKHNILGRINHSFYVACSVYAYQSQTFLKIMLFPISQAIYTSKLGLCKKLPTNISCYSPFNCYVKIFLHQMQLVQPALLVLVTFMWIRVNYISHFLAINTVCRHILLYTQRADCKPCQQWSEDWQQTSSHCLSCSGPAAAAEHPPPLLFFGSPALISHLDR